MLSINILQRVLGYLCINRTRLEYDWKALWSATLGLLNFLASKAQSIPTSIEIEGLIEETVAFLEFVLSRSGNILPSAKALHEFIYELIRFADGIRKLRADVRDSVMVVSSPSNRTTWVSKRTSEERLSNIIDIVSFYENKISNAKAGTAKDAMRVVAQDIERQGLHGVKSINVDSEPPKRGEDAIGFIRYGYNDILALMP